MLRMIPRRRSPLLTWPGLAAIVPSPTVYTTFKPALVAFVNATPAVTQLLADDPDGAPCFGPVHPSESDLWPSLTWKVIDRTPGLDFDDDAGYAEAEVEFEGRSEDPADVDQILAALWKVFHSKVRYAMSGVAVMVSYAGPDSDDYDPGDDSSDDGTFSDTVTITFRYRTR
jgi:hypothetical protein